MPAIDNLLKRLGFVKLARYGLVLTPEGRIMSLRPAVLEDELGSKIVGWAEGDLAAMELQKWEPARPAPQAAVATRVAATPPPAPKPAPVPRPVNARIGPQVITSGMPSVAPLATVVAAPVAAPAVPSVAQPPQVDEDDWEWTIAIARARAETPVEQPAAPVQSAPRPRLRTVPPSAKTMPMAAVAAPAPAPKLSVVKIATVNDTQRTPIVAAPSPTRAMPAATVAPRRDGTSPPTIIPVPRLPTLKTERQQQIQPVVAARTSRLAKGTAPPPPIRSGDDDTKPNMILDKTSPNIALPPAARAVALPSIKRLAR